jgi:predicted acylesterase/phospholipase RssA
MESPGTDALRFLLSARRVGFVFSGGSARCAFQVGAVESLLELGVRPALCVGVSGGVWNAAAVAVGHAHRLRYYWRAFSRMQGFDLRNLLGPDHSPFRWRELHRRTFGRYVSAARLRQPETLPVYVGVTRLAEGQAVWFDARTFEDPFLLMLASNYLPPLYTHAPRLRGELYGDGGFSNNLPYEKAFEEGCDAVVLITMKGESEGLPYRSPREAEHAIPPAFRDRVVMIRPRHRLAISFVERRWPIILQTMELGRLRTREKLLGESHPETDVRAAGTTIGVALARLLLRRMHRSSL